MNNSKRPNNRRDTDVRNYETSNSGDSKVTLIGVTNGGRVKQIITGRL